MNLQINSISSSAARFLRWPLLALLVVLSGCSNDQPKVVSPLSYEGVPRDVKKVTGHWKMGDFTIGYRIVTDEYVFVTDGGGLYGQEGQGIVGPGMVQAATVESFGRIARQAEIAEGASEKMKFFGDLVHRTDNKEVYRFEGKPVVFLFTAEYHGTTLEVNRRPWDN